MLEGRPRGPHLGITAERERSTGQPRGVAVSGAGAKSWIQNTPPLSIAPSGVCQEPQGRVRPWPLRLGTSRRRDDPSQGDIAAPTSPTRPPVQLRAHLVELRGPVYPHLP